MVAQLAGGTEVEVLERGDTRARIRLADGLIAWVDASSLDRLATTTRGGGFVACLLAIGLLLLLLLGVVLYVWGRIRLGQAQTGARPASCRRDSTRDH